MMRFYRIVYEVQHRRYDGHRMRRPLYLKATSLPKSDRLTELIAEDIKYNSPMDAEDALLIYPLLSISQLEEDDFEIMKAREIGAPSAEFQVRVHTWRENADKEQIG